MQQQYDLTQQHQVQWGSLESSAVSSNNNTGIIVPPSPQQVVTDMHVRIQKLEEADKLMQVRIQELEEADKFRGRILIGEAAMKIQLLIDYIISIESKTIPIWNKPLDRLANWLELSTKPQKVAYRTLTETYSGEGEEREKRTQVLEIIKIEFNLSQGVEPFIAKACHGRDAEIHVTWTEKHYSLFEHVYIQGEKSFSSKGYFRFGQYFEGIIC